LADLSDVENALVTLIMATLYPQGINGASAIGAAAFVSRGWPLATQLDAVVAANQVEITVFSDPGMTRDTSRYWPFPAQTGSVLPTISATVAGNLVKLGGIITAGNVVGIQAGAPVQAYATAVLSTDTLATLAARLAGLISGATVQGAEIVMPATVNLQAAVMVPNTSATEVRRQDQGLRLTVWAPSPALRDTTASLIDQAIAALRDINGNLTRFLTILPGETGPIRYLRTYVDDKPQKAGVWRRDLLYHVEYPTTAIETDPAMLFGVLTVINPSA
jgi:hypothetical protein